MAVSIDGYVTTTAGGTSQPFTLSNVPVLASGNDRMVLLLYCQVAGGAGPLESAPQFNSTNMTRLATDNVAEFGNYGTVDIWYILDNNMPSGSGNYNLTGTTHSTNCWNCYPIAVSVSGVAQSAPDGYQSAKANGNPVGSPATVNITPSSANGTVIDIVDGMNGTSWTEGSGQTLIGDNTLVANRFAGCSKEDHTTTAQRTMSWTWSGSANTWLIYAISLLDADGGAEEQNAVFFGSNF